MKIIVGVVVATLGALGCGGGSTMNGNDGGDVNTLFPFSGPSCMGGPPGYSRNVVCGRCEVGACSAKFSCVTSDCSALFNCACACPLDDNTCASRCPLSGACQVCFNGLRTCSDQAGVGVCSAECGSDGGTVGGD